MRVLTAVWALCLVACFGEVSEVAQHLPSCDARVEEAPPPPLEPDGTVEQAYADDTCAARPVAVVRGKVPAEIVTSEPGWHYDGSDPKVRRYSREVPLERACWRVEGGNGCACRDLTEDERAFGE